MSNFLPAEASLEKLQATQDALYESTLIEALVDEGAHVKVGELFFFSNEVMVVGMAMATHLP
jgi:hypothetical protein